nr:hypothetical protein [Tanacetum cinerariifolium]
DPYEEAAQQLLEQAPRSPEYIHDPIELEDHVPAHIPEHPEDLVPAEDEAPIEAYIHEITSAPTPPLPPSFYPYKDRAAVKAEIEVLRRERLAYEQESIHTCEALARSEAYSRALEARVLVLEARVLVLETQARRYEWQCHTADDFVVQHIMRTQALEAGARIDTLEDTGSSS